jgi:ABC-type branched-subunit amino acid transport system ATPase component
LRERGLAILLAEQRIEVTAAVGDDVLFISHGRIVEQTRADDPELEHRAHRVYLGGEGPPGRAVLPGAG